MSVITLNKSEFEQACDSLAVKLAESGDITALIGVRSGGATVAKLVFGYLEKQGGNLEYFEAGASRYATAAKKTRSIKILFKFLPRFILDWLRIVEHYIVTLRMKLSDDVERDVRLDSRLVDYLANLESGRIIIIDDAIDSGATVKILLDELCAINPLLEYKIAVLVVTKNVPLVYPDFCLYKNVLLRFPWSSDYKS
ncbi:MAG: phosphoribosyltransferase family protein [Gammaproteobacteria bacterium]|nr:phosphoribosyltransferase family protein [Gammaproteobacteria bacterium]